MITNELIKEIMAKGSRPSKWVSPRGYRYEIIPQNIYGGGEWFVINNNEIYYHL